MNRDKENPNSDNGGVFRKIDTAVSRIPKLLLKIVFGCGLWVPATYAILGVVLYFGFSFDPFDFSLESCIYLSGAVASVVCAVILFAKNAIYLPAKKIFSRKKKTDLFRLRQKGDSFEREKECERRILPPLFEDKKKPDEKIYYYDWLPEKKENEPTPQVTSRPKYEEPQVYFSKLRPEILVHEYVDRFELFKIGKNNELISIGVEYK